MATAQDRLNQILPSWYDLLTQWSLDGSLVAAATDALMLESSNAKQDAKGQLQSYVSQWSAGNFQNLPKIVLLAAADISGAYGAYADSTDTMYLNQEWLMGASEEEIQKVLTEELGHYFDDQLNQADTQGDEGEIFANTLLDRMQSRIGRLQLTTEDDTIGITLGSELIEAQAASITDNRDISSQWDGTDQDDLLFWYGLGSDVINGKNGYDTLSLAWKKSDVSVTRNSAGVDLATIGTQVLSLINIERISFSDGETLISPASFSSVVNDNRDIPSQWDGTDQDDLLFWYGLGSDVINGKNGYDTLSLAWKKSDVSVTRNSAGVDLATIGTQVLSLINIERISFSDGETLISPASFSSVVNDNRDIPSQWDGTDQDDLLFWYGLGSDVINGKNGYDTLSLAWKKSDVSVTRNSAGVDLATIGTQVLSLINIERISFSDGETLISPASFSSVVNDNRDIPSQWDGTDQDDLLFWYGLGSDVINGKNGYDTLSLAWKKSDVSVTRNSAGVDLATIGTQVLSLINIERISFSDGETLISPASFSSVVNDNRDIPSQWDGTDQDDLLFWYGLGSDVINGKNGYDTLSLAWKKSDVSVTRNSAGVDLATIGTQVLSLINIERISFSDGETLISPASFSSVVNDNRDIPSQWDGTDQDDLLFWYGLGSDVINGKNGYDTLSLAWKKSDVSVTRNSAGVDLATIGTQVLSLTNIERISYADGETILDGTSSAPSLRGNSLYLVVDGPSWTQAETNAINLGGHLAAISDEGENSYVFSTFGPSGSPSDEKWIGLNDAEQEGVWEWSNGEEVSYANWAFVAPANNVDIVYPDNSGSETQDYVNFWWGTNDGTWDDYFDNDGEHDRKGIAEIPLTLSISIPTTIKEGSGAFTTSISLSAGNETSGNLAEGSTVYWKVSGISQEDLASGELSGSGVVTDGKLDIQHSLLDDGIAEQENFEVSVYSDAEMLHQIGGTYSQAIADSSESESVVIDFSGNRFNWSGTEKSDTLVWRGGSEIVDGLGGRDTLKVASAQGNVVVFDYNGDDYIYLPYPNLEGGTLRLRNVEDISFEASDNGAPAYTLGSLENACRIFSSSSQFEIYTNSLGITYVFGDFASIFGGQGLNPKLYNGTSALALYDIEQIVFNDKTLDITLPLDKVVDPSDLQDLYGGFPDPTLVVDFRQSYWEGTSQDDILVWRNGGDNIDGKDGIDTLSLGEISSKANMITNSFGVTYINGLALVNVERIEFIDDIVIDLKPLPNTSYVMDTDGRINSWMGTLFDDVLVWMGGSDRIDGDAGYDTLSLAYNRSQVELSASGENFTILVPPTNGEGGQLSLFNIERVSLIDGDIYLSETPAPSFDAANSLVIKSAGSGTLDGLPFEEIYTFNLGLDSDTVIIEESAGTEISMTIEGGEGTDTLNSSSLKNKLVLTGVNQGTLDGIQFSGIENINLGSGNDEVYIMSGGMLTGLLNGGSGGTVTYVPPSGDIGDYDGGGTGGAGGDGYVDSGGNPVTTDPGPTTPDPIEFKPVPPGFKFNGGLNSIFMNDEINIASINGPGYGVVDGTDFLNFYALDLKGNDDIATINPLGYLFGKLSGGDGSDTLNFSANSNVLSIDQSLVGDVDRTDFESFEIINLLAGDDSVSVNINALPPSSSDPRKSLTLNGGEGVDQLTLKITREEVRYLESQGTFDELQAYLVNPTGTTITIALSSIDLTLTDFESTGFFNSSPTQIAITSTQFDENLAVGSVVASLSAVDPDQADGLTYRFVGSNGFANLQSGIFTLDGDKVEISSVPDYETSSSYEVTVRVSDDYGAYFDQKFTFTVNDVFEPTSIVGVANASGTSTPIIVSGTSTLPVVETFTITKSGKGRTATSVYNWSPVNIDTATRPLDALVVNGGDANNTITGAGFKDDPATTAIETRTTFTGVLVIDGKGGADTITGGTGTNWLIGGGVTSSGTVDTLTGTSLAKDVFDLRRESSPSVWSDAYAVSNAVITSFGGEDFIMLSGQKNDYTFNPKITQVLNKRGKVVSETVSFEILSKSTNDLVATVAGSGFTSTTDLSSYVVFGQTTQGPFDVVLPGSTGGTII